MSSLNVSESARATDKSRATIQRYIKQGKLSVSKDNQGNIQISVAELIRVFGELKTNGKKESMLQDVYQATPIVQHDTPLKMAFDVLNEQLKASQEQLKLSQERESKLLDILKQEQERNNKLEQLMLPASKQQEVKKGFFSRFFGL